MKHLHFIRFFVSCSDGQWGGTIPDQKWEYRAYRATHFHGNPKKRAFIACRWGGEQLTLESEPMHLARRDKQSTQRQLRAGSLSRAVFEVVRLIRQPQRSAPNVLVRSAIDKTKHHEALNRKNSRYRSPLRVPPAVKARVSTLLVTKRAGIGRGRGVRQATRGAASDTRDEPTLLTSSNITTASLRLIPMISRTPGSTR